LTKRIKKAGRSPEPKDNSGKKVSTPTDSPESAKAVANTSTKPSGRRERQDQILEFECRIPAWKLAFRVIGFSLVVFLTVALILSDMALHRFTSHSYSLREISLYVVLLCFNAMILIPAVFEVRLAKSTPDALILRTLWWGAKVSWKEIVQFRNPSYLKFALIRTRRCFYLLNKRDLSNYTLLESSLNSQIKGSAGKKRKS
jgi:hypothetical protein